MADDFRLLVGTKIVDSNIQKQLDAMPPKSIKVTPTVGGTKELKKVTDAMGNVYGVTTKYDKVGKELSKTISSMDEGIVKVSKDLKTVETYTKKHTDAMGRMVTETTKYNKAGEQVGETTRKYSDAIVKAEKHVSSLGEKFVANTKKVAQFAMSTAILSAFSGAIYKAVEAVKEFDVSLTELKKVSDLSGDGLKTYTDDAFQMASDLSTTASNVTDAVALFVQAGSTLEEAKGLAKYSIMLQSISDRALDAETSAGFLTTTIKAFNMQASDAEHIISAVNQVSNEYAITSNDLSENIGKVAGVANQAGVSYDELIGLMTSAVSKGSSASKTANAYKSLFINLQQMNSDGTMPKLSAQFDEFGISMTDTNGATKDAFQLLKELSGVYKEVSDSTDIDKQNKMKTLLEDIGG